MRIPLRFVVPAVVVVALLSTAAACRGGADPRPDRQHEPLPLTAAQAEQLAVVRFENFRSGALRGSITAPGPQPLDAQVLIDFRRHLGLAVDIGAGRPAQIAWDGTTVWVVPGADDPFHGHLPPAKAWRAAPMNEQNPVDLFLALVLKLGSDRPENPQLLQQSTARYLRKERIGGRELRVFSGPRAPGASGGNARTTYWLDEGGDLVRFEAAVWGSTPAVLRLDRDENVQMPGVVGRLSRLGAR